MTGRRGRISEDRGRRILRPILNGIGAVLEAEGPLTYEAIADRAQLERQLVKEFVESADLRDLPGDLLTELHADSARSFDALLVTSAVAEVWGPSRAFSTHLAAPAPISALCDLEELPGGLRARLEAGRRAARNTRGGVANAYGVVAGDEHLVIARTMPFALDGWFARNHYSEWADHKTVAQAIRSAARVGDECEIADNPAELMRQIVDLIGRLEDAGFLLWLEGGRLTHGYAADPQEAAPLELLPANPFPGSFIEFLGADFDALAIAFEHSRVLLDLPDPFDPSFAKVKLAFRVPGHEQPLAADQLRQTLPSDVASTLQPRVEWRQLSREQSADYTRSCRANPPDVSWLPCKLGKPGEKASLPATLVLYTAGADARTSLFVTGPIRTEVAHSSGIDVPRVVRQVQRHINRFREAAPLTEELRCQWPSLATRARGFHPRANLDSLAAMARVLGSA